MRYFKCDGWCETTHTHVEEGCNCEFCRDDFNDHTGEDLQAGLGLEGFDVSLAQKLGITLEAR
jgi:hypothetical protein